MEVYIEFTSPKKQNPFSWIIQKVQKTPYSHVRLRWVSSTGVDIVYEASRASVRFVGPIAQTTHPVFVHDSFKLGMTKEQYMDMVRVCMTYAGVQYSFLQVFGIGLASLLGLNTNPFTNGARGQICSELVARVFQEVYGKELGVDLDKAGPLEIHRALERMYDRTKDITSP